MKPLVCISAAKSNRLTLRRTRGSEAKPEELLLSAKCQGFPPAGTRPLKVREYFFILSFHSNFLDNDVISLKLKLDMTIV